MECRAEKSLPASAATRATGHSNLQHSTAQHSTAAITRASEVMDLTDQLTCTPHTTLTHV